MSVTPEKYIFEEKKLERRPRPMNGWLALSPLLVFLGVYLVSSLLAHDFYKVPVSSAFLLASIWSVAITRGPIDERISTFSRGAGDKNVLLMIWIFVLAGVFARTAKETGAIDAIVNLTLAIVPGHLMLAGLFLASCFISMAIGTSVGTIVGLVPLASGLAEETGAGLAMITGAIVGGAFFGDNLSFISDTTIAATKSQGCSMSDKFRANSRIALPAALAVTVLYIFLGRNLDMTPEAGHIEFLLLIPYITVMVLAICGMNVTEVLCIGIALNAILGISLGRFGWTGFLTATGLGIADMGDLIIVTMLAGGMLEVIRCNGGLDFLIDLLTRHIRGYRGAAFSIAGLVAFANICTANNTIAIITTGSIAKDIGTRFGIKAKKVASILDTFSCIIQGILPYGAQLLMASGLAGISTFSIIGSLYYPLALAVTACLAIIFFGAPKK